MTLDQTNDPATGFPGRTIFSKVGGYGGNFGFSNSSHKLFLKFNADGQAWLTYSAAAILPQPVPANVWQHVAASYDNDTIKLYPDEVLWVADPVGPVTLADSSSSRLLATLAWNSLMAVSTDLLRTLRFQLVSGQPEIRSPQRERRESLPAPKQQFA